jgi:hypothetical protein
MANGIAFDKTSNIRIQLNNFGGKTERKRVLVRKRYR